MIIQYILVIWIHFISDFVFQSDRITTSVLQLDRITTSKSYSIKYLSLHCLIYSLPMVTFGWKFALINGILHFIVDFVTSKLTAYYWKINRMDNFFLIIGLGQATHITCLMLSLNYL